MTAVAIHREPALDPLHKVWSANPGYGSYQKWTKWARKGKLQEFGVFKDDQGHWLCPAPPPQEMLDKLAAGPNRAGRSKVTLLRETREMGIIHAGFQREYQDSLDKIQELRRELMKVNQRADKAEARAERAEARVDRLLDRLD